MSSRMCNLESDPGGLLAVHLRPNKTPAYRLSARTNASQRVIRLESLGYTLALSAKRYLEVKENTRPPSHSHVQAFFEGVESDDDGDYICLSSYRHGRGNTAQAL